MDEIMTLITNEEEYREGLGLWPSVSILHKNLDD